MLNRDKKNINIELFVILNVNEYRLEFYAIFERYDKLNSADM